MYFAQVDTEGGAVEYRVAVIAFPEGDDTYLVEWLEGPDLGSRSYLDADDVRYEVTVADAVRAIHGCDCAVVPNYPYCEDGARNGGVCRNLPERFRD